MTPEQAADKVYAATGVLLGTDKAPYIASYMTVMETRIAELEAALSAAAEDIGTWGSQASQYSQEKWDLEGDVKRYIAIAEGKLPYRARHPMETWKDE